MLSVVMYKDLGVVNTDIALYTSWLYLPWVIKPLWSPLVDMFRTKRWWIVSLQLVIGASLAHGGADHAPAGLLPDQPGRAVADGLQLGHPRHRRRRLLHAGPAPAAAGRVRRRAQHLLPARHARRAGRPGVPGRPADRTHGRRRLRLVGGVLRAGGHVPGAVRLSPLHAAAPGRGPRRWRTATTTCSEFFATFAAFFKQARHLADPRLHPDLPPGRIAAAQAGRAVPERSGRQGRPGPDHRAGRHRLQHRRRHRADPGRAARRLRHLAPGPEALPVADGVLGAHSRPGVRLPGQRAAAEPGACLRPSSRWNSSATASASRP